jgi:hypothetical protein
MRIFKYINVGGYVVIKKKLIKQLSGVYTLTIPKDIVEAKGWENSEIKIELKGDKIVLTKIGK